VETGSGVAAGPGRLRKRLATTSYTGGRIPGHAFSSARWDLLPERGYMWGSVQTVRGLSEALLVLLGLED
jgi:hypothetical protein